MSDHYDVIIIGTGAGGGTLLNKLAPSGKRILVLERGPFLPREKENWNTKGMFVVAFLLLSIVVLYLNPKQSQRSDFKCRIGAVRRFDRATGSTLQEFRTLLK